MNVSMVEEALVGAKGMYESGAMSKEEFLEILRGFQAEEMIAESAEEMAKKEELNTYIVSAINIVSAVA